MDAVQNVLYVQYHTMLQEASIGLVDDPIAGGWKEGPRAPNGGGTESARAKDERACVDLVVNAKPMCVWMHGWNAATTLCDAHERGSRSHIPAMVPVGPHTRDTYDPSAFQTSTK